jgi:serine/threonine-protein kinase HipA
MVRQLHPARHHQSHAIAQEQQRASTRIKNSNKAMTTKFKPVEIVEVQVWGARAGAIARDPGTGFLAFEYDPKFVKRGIELAPLQMPLKEASNVFLFPNLPEPTYQRLPAMLADALPDKFGNALIDAWMGDRGVSKNEITTLDRLAYMGERTMGALTFKPARGPKKTASAAVEMSKLVKQARIAVNGNLGDEDSSAAVLRQIIQVGTSAGGARAKAAIAWDDQTQDVRSGQFDIPPGYEAWLLKFDGVGVDAQLGPGKHYGRIEYAYHLMARAAGIHMADCHLLEEGGRAHFMTRRFDRTGNIRHHVQSLCAMAHLDFNQIGTHSYNQLFSTIIDLGLGRDALVETLRRMVFNVLACNCDDHTKNFAFLLQEGKQWALAPAYDITHSYNPANKWICQHLMSVNGKFRDISLRDVREVADRFGVLGDCSSVVDKAKVAIQQWPTFAEIANLDADETKRIANDLMESFENFG